MDAKQLVEEYPGNMVRGTEILAGLKEKKLVAGLVERVLEVDEVKPGLHETAEGIKVRPIYRIRWHCLPFYLFGLWPLPGTGKGTGRFIKVAHDRIKMPPEAGRRKVAADSRETDEIAVFLSTRLADSHLEAILATRIAGLWLELYRWNASWIELGLSRLDICSF